MEYSTTELTVSRPIAGQTSVLPAIKDGVDGVALFNDKLFMELTAHPETAATVSVVVVGTVGKATEILLESGVFTLDNIAPAGSVHL
jgi:hypothetical protein